MPKNIRMNLLLPDELKEYFDDVAGSMGISRNAVIVMALKQHMEQQKALKDVSGLKVLIDKIDELKNNLPK